ncbi:MAG: Coenzyme F420 hydrogenase/dehydrogenase, beta subunit C-terminal domain [Pseudomonadota bacterium]
MNHGYLLSTADKGPLEALRGFLKSGLDRGAARAILTPRRGPGTGLIMPTLVANPALLDQADPLAPCFPLNAARMVSRLTRRELDDRIAVVLRPCEIRALVELVKIKQGDLDNVVIIGLDCPGAYSTAGFMAAAAKGWTDEDALAFFRAARSNPLGLDSDPHLASACRVCEHPTPQGADVRIGMWGLDREEAFWVEAPTEKGAAFIGGLELPAAAEPPGRSGLVAALTAARTDKRDAMFEAVHQASGDLERLDAYFSRCVSCYNCRTACPVCYCRQCVFTTDVFDHEPRQYLMWAERKGAVGLPADKVFFHLTRMVHMSLSCVGCGQCSNACPNGIPVMEIFRAAAHKTQAAFDYQAGMDLEQPPPLSVFLEKEFEEVVG